MTHCRSELDVVLVYVLETLIFKKRKDRITDKYKLKKE